MELDLTKLDADQLNAIAVVCPDAREAVKDELEKRMAFPSWKEAFTDVALASQRLELFFENTRHTESVRTIINMGLVPLMRQLLATARVHGIAYEKPKLNDVLSSPSE